MPVTIANPASTDYLPRYLDGLAVPVAQLQTESRLRLEQLPPSVFDHAVRGELKLREFPPKLRRATAAAALAALLPSILDKAFKGEL